MFYILTIDDYLEILADKEVAKSLYIFLITPDEVEKYVQ